MESSNKKREINAEKVDMRHYECGCKTKLDCDSSGRSGAKGHTFPLKVPLCCMSVQTSQGRGDGGRYIKESENSALVVLLRR